MKPASFVVRLRRSLFVVALLTVALTVTDPMPGEAAASPKCEAFANAPELVDGAIVTDGGAYCTSAVTGLFRVDVTLYRDGAQVEWDGKTCRGEQQCGLSVVGADVEGGQEWCATTVGVLTGAAAKGTGGAPRTEMICESEPF